MRTVPHSEQVGTLVSCVGPTLSASTTVVCQVQIDNGKLPIPVISRSSSRHVVNKIIRALDQPKNPTNIYMHFGWDRLVSLQFIDERRCPKPQKARNITGSLPMYSTLSERYEIWRGSPFGLASELRCRPPGVRCTKTWPREVQNGFVVVLQFRPLPGDATCRLEDGRQSSPSRDIISSGIPLTGICTSPCTSLPPNTESTFTSKPDLDVPTPILCASRVIFKR